MSVRTILPRNIWRAVLVSRGDSIRRRVHARCAHDHESDVLAWRCADRLNKYAVGLLAWEVEVTTYRLLK